MRVEEGWAQTEGVIVDSNEVSGSKGGTTYAPVAEYTVDGKTYTASSSSSTSKIPKIGDTVTVAYNTEAPKQGRVQGVIGLDWFTALLGLSGIGVAVLFTVKFVRSIQRSRQINQLKINGQKVQGEIIGARYAETGRRQAPTVILTVTAPDSSGALQTYESDKLVWADQFIRVDHERYQLPVTVYLDTTNPENYYVDIESIPPLNESMLRPRTNLWKYEGLGLKPSKSKKKGED